MVKIPLTVEQIENLLKWRDENLDLVRACVVPFPECSILSENGMKVRVEQLNKTLLYSFTVTDCNAGLVKGRFVWDAEVKTVYHGTPELSHDNTQTALTVWASVMAYIANFKREVIECDEPAKTQHRESQGRTERSKRNTSRDRVIYLRPIVNKYGKIEEQRRKYTAPDHAFSVRGHYRHYKSGKVVFVQPYEKNTGKEKDKRNKVVKIMEV